MIFVYKKGTHELVGYAARIFDNGKWREATIEELYPKMDASKLGFVVVKDSPKYSMNLNGWQFTLDEEGEPNGIERKPNPPRIIMTTTAEDTDGDGMPELPADGTTEADIHLAIQDGDGNTYEEPMTVKISTSGGSLSARIMTVEDGQAIIKLRSSRDTITAKVSVEAEGVEGDSITFEFMPE